MAKPRFQRASSDGFQSQERFHFDIENHSQQGFGACDQFVKSLLWVNRVWKTVMPEESAPYIVENARKFMQLITHARVLGIEMKSLGNGRAVMSMPFDMRIAGDRTKGIIHGGAVSTLMDTVAAAAVMCHPVSPKSTATLDLRIDYMRAARPLAGINAKAECYHTTRSVAFVRVTAWDEDENHPVAMAAGAFSIELGGV